VGLELESTSAFTLVEAPVGLVGSLNIGDLGREVRFVYLILCLPRQFVLSPPWAKELSGR
jgi:hypothetical protein